MTPAVTPGRATGVRIVPYSAAESGAVRAFNDRMIAGRAPTDFVLPDRPNEPDAGRAPAIRWTKYLAMDEAEARGGFVVMEQPGWLNGQSVDVVNYQSPVSEGILDARHGMVGMHMLRFVQRQWPYAFVVGMGSADRPLPRLLAAAGWTLRPLPFLFRIVRARRVLRELPALQRRGWTRIGARIAAATGAGWIGSTLLHARGLVGPGSTLRIERVSSWGEWTDTVWNRVREAQTFTVVRDRATLTCLYPLDDDRYTAYRFSNGSGVTGWAVCALADMRGHSHFGSLRVATVLDAMTPPADAPAAAARLSKELSSWADLIVTNQSHAMWIGAFRAAGYAAAPSNYLLATSKRLTEAIGGGLDRIHVTRGDGDGRIHLLNRSVP